MPSCSGSQGWGHIALPQSNPLSAEGGEAFGVRKNNNQLMDGGQGVSARDSSARRTEAEMREMISSSQEKEENL